MQHSTQQIIQGPEKHDPMELIGKYIALLIRKKYWIVLGSFSVGVFWFLAYSIILVKPPVYSASAVLRFEDDPRYSARVSAVTDFAQMRTESKLAILNTKKFLEKIVDSLNYNVMLITPGINRSKLFKDIKLTENLKFGSYILKYLNNSLQIYFTNRKEKIENQLIHTVNVLPDSDLTVNLNGIKVKLDKNIVLANREIKFFIIPKDRAAIRLGKNLTGDLDLRSRSILRLTYNDFDPNYAAVVTNTVAKFFIEQLLEYKRFRTRSVLNSLEGQLKVSKSELKMSENNLRQFRERHPFLFLNANDENTVSELTTQQQELFNSKQNRQILSGLLEKKQKQTNLDKTLIYQEILSSLQDLNFPGVAVISDRYNSIVDEKSTLLSSNYSLQHPDVQDVVRRINELEKNIDGRLVQHISELTQQIHNLEKSINVTETNLRQLPRNELRLAELQRDKEVKENIYTNILNRYNEAKVSDAAVIPDAYIIDYAEPPLSQAMVSLDKLIYFAGLFAGFFITIGLIILLDYFDKTAREVDNVQNVLKIPVLATLPIIGEEKETPNHIDLNKKLDIKLITSDYAPHIAGESFRILRTKILMVNESEKHKSLIVASLNPGEGKSLVSANLAITFAQQKIPTILIDCDLRRGVLHNSFASNKKPGIADLLHGNSDLNMKEISQVIQKTHIPNLFLLSSGMQIPNPSESLGGDRMRELYNELKKEFGMILFDTPPLDYIPDALVINNFIHQIMLVVRYGRTNISKLNRKMLEYVHLKNNFIGVVINASNEMIPKGYSTYSYYQY